MRIGLLLLCFYWLSSSATQASTLIDLGNTSCSGIQSLDSSNGLMLNCSGDFSLSMGTLSSKTGISLFSSGNLTLDKFNLSAPNIRLFADSILIKSTASLIGNSIDLSTNTIVYDGQPTSPGSDIQIVAGRDIIIPRPLRDIKIPKPLLDSVGSITLLPGGDVSAGNGNSGSGIRLPSAPGGDILIGTPKANLILPPRIIDSREIIVLLPPVLLPPRIIGSVEGGILLTPHLTVTSSIPLPASFITLLTGLLMMASVSGRRFSGKVQS